MKQLAKILRRLADAIDAPPPKRGRPRGSRKVAPVAPLFDAGTRPNWEG